MNSALPSSITMATSGTVTCLVGVPSPPTTPTSLPSTPLDPLTDDSASYSPDDTVSLKSWFETSLTSASRMAQRWTMPILGRKDAPAPEPLYDVFLGGSCGHTVWRSEIVIPYLKKRAITYYDPQRPVWSEHMIYEEALAKESSRLFLFVLDPGTINATSFLEIAYFAARRAPKLVVVFLGRREWSDQAHPMDLPDRIRTCNLLEAILKRHSVPMLTSINEALDYIDDMIIGAKSFTTAMSEPLQRLPYLQLKAKRVMASAKTATKDSFGYFKSRCASITSKAIIIILLEVLLVLSLHFYLLPAIPLMVFVIPIISIDYLIAIAAVVYFRFKVRRRMYKLNRKVVLPAPPIPRIGQSAVADHARKKSNASSTSGTTSSPMELLRNNDVMSVVDTEVRTHFKEQLDLRCQGSPRRLTRDEKLERNGCVTSPVGYDVFLSCSSGSELEWIRQKAVPQLHKSGLTYTSAIMCDKEMRIPMLHTASHILYYIPSYKTFLSGMIEIAYFIGHSDWQVTVCVPREAECLVLLDDTQYDPETVAAVERRNASYRMAFCYLKDMAQRRQCRVFTKVEEAIKHIGDQSRRDTEHKALLRQIVEKQHLVKERTQDQLLTSPTSSTTSLSK